MHSGSGRAVLQAACSECEREGCEDCDNGGYWEEKSLITNK